MKAALSVNLNKIALLRNSRGEDYPNLLEYADIALSKGVQGITLHPRPDQRHAKYSDLQPISLLIKTDYPDAELNIEGFPSEQFLSEVLELQPNQCTLVPDLPGQITSNNGWKLLEQNKILESAINTLRKANIRVSLFIEAKSGYAQIAKQLGAHAIELYTGPYAKLHSSDDDNLKLLLPYIETTNEARRLSLRVNAGHDLNTENLGIFITSMHIDEVSIGHGIIVDALKYGFVPTIEKYLSICEENENTLISNSR